MIVIDRVSVGCVLRRICVSTHLESIDCRIPDHTLVSSRLDPEIHSTLLTPLGYKRSYIMSVVWIQISDKFKVFKCLLEAWWISTIIRVNF